MAMVLAACPEVEVVGFDMWMEDYAGMENPGANFVKTMPRLEREPRTAQPDGSG